MCFILFGCSSRGSSYDTTYFTDSEESITSDTVSSLDDSIVKEDIYSHNYVSVVIFKDIEDEISICLYLNRDKVQRLESKMIKKNRHANMSGYNWDVFLNKYLEYNEPEILEVISPDPEYCMYAAYIEGVSEENKKLARDFGMIIDHLIEDESAALDFLDKHGDEIEWE